MKKTIFSLAIALMMGTSVFAAKTNSSNDEVNSLAVQSFNKEFVGAKNIMWEQKSDFIRATFTMNGQILFAYYNNDGALTAVVRNIRSEQLPISLLTSLKNDYTKFWISDLFEMASGDQTSYYITIENADKKIVLRSNGNEGWEVYSKTRKNAE
jgi:hypothetical protein